MRGVNIFWYAGNGCTVAGSKHVCTLKLACVKLAREYGETYDKKYVFSQYENSKFSGLYPLQGNYHVIAQRSQQIDID